MVLNALLIGCKKVSRKDAKKAKNRPIRELLLTPPGETLSREILLTFILLSLSLLPLNSQYIQQNPVPNDVYSFLDEFNLPYNSSVKPMGRERIKNLLLDIDPSSLNNRQQKELSFYLKDFNKETLQLNNSPHRIDALYLRDSLFSLTLNPIGGGTFWNTAEGSAYHWWNGLYAMGKMGNWGFFASLTDNHESENLMSPDYLTQRQGGSNIKSFSDGKQDYWDSRGGITYGWKHGHIGLIKDNFSWGSGYNGSNIFSGRSPSFVHLSLNLRPVKWFEFNYIHGWLVSEVVDSTRSFFYSHPSGSVFRRTYHGKFIAANLFSFKPLKNIYISAGNSIVYDYNNLHPAYLIPVLFYKAVDHHLQSGMDNMNSMLFLDLSVKIIPNTHLYLTAFMDEIAVKRIFNPDEFNFLSYKGGIKLSNLIPNTFAILEYTWTNALAYRHYVPTLSFESNRYNLGHYLTDNAKELFISTGIKPLPGLNLNVSFTNARKGPDHTLLGTQRVGIVPFSPIVWESNSFSFNASWQIINDIWLNAGYTRQETKGEEEYLERYTPSFWNGNKGAVNFGLSVGRH